jgi:hypothetical protein
VARTSPQHRPARRATLRSSSPCRVSGGSSSPRCLRKPRRPYGQETIDPCGRCRAQLR